MRDLPRVHPGVGNIVALSEEDSISECIVISVRCDHMCKHRSKSTPTGESFQPEITTSAFSEHAIMRCFLVLETTQGNSTH